MKFFVDFWKFNMIWKGFQHRNTELFLFWILDDQNNFIFTTCKNSQKGVKNQKSTDKHSSFDGLIQEDIDLSDIYLAVTTLDITSNYGNSDRQHALRSTHKNWAFREDAEVKEPAMDRKRVSLELGATAPIAIADQCTNRLRHLKSHWNLHTSRILHDVERNTWKWEILLAAVFEFVYAIAALIFIF